MEKENLKLEMRDLLSLEVDTPKVEFKKEVRAKMKELGYNHYAKLVYNGIMFTTNKVAVVEAIQSGDIAYAELKHTLIEDAEGNLTKPGYELVKYYTYAQLNKMEEMENKRALRSFKTQLFNVDTLVKNPSLLNQLDLIEKITEASA
jgi:hypothetical protein